MENSEKKVSILGAGLVGSLLAIYLAKRNYKISIFERRPDLRHADIDVGRSINMALSERGWNALKKLGITEDINEVAIPMYGRMIHQMNETVAYQPYGKDGQAIYSVSRSGFTAKLISVAEKNENIEFFFNEKCWDVDLNNGVSHFENTITGKRLNNKADLVFGADGAFSSLRNAMQKTERYNYSQYYLEHCYKELSIPAINGKHQLDPNALHIWPRGQFMLIALPNLDGSFTCTLFLPFKGLNSFQNLKEESSLFPFFSTYFKDVIPLMPNLKKQFYKNPTSSLVTINCFPWCYEDKTCLIGDAAHTITPFFGQGMNAGFEDINVLDDLIDKHNENWELILEEYQFLRKPDADAIAELAMQNFIEMRDLVSDEAFLLRKKIEALIYSQHPTIWIPLYTMVTFSNIRYSKALETGKIQDKILKKIMKIDNIKEIWESIDYLPYLNELV